MSDFTTDSELLDARTWLIKIARYLGDQAEDLESRTAYDLGARAWEVLDDAHDDLLDALRRINDPGCERSWSISGRCLSDRLQTDWCDACIAGYVLPPAKLAPGVVLNRRSDLDACPDGSAGRDANGFLVQKQDGRWWRVNAAAQQEMAIKEPIRYVRLLDLGGDPDPGVDS